MPISFRDLSWHGFKIHLLFPDNREFSWQTEFHKRVLIMASKLLSQLSFPLINVCFKQHTFSVQELIVPQRWLRKKDWFSWKPKISPSFSFIYRYSTNIAPFMSVNYTEWFIMLKKNENRRKKNVWFHSQTNLNLHYKEKGFAGWESIDCTKQCTKVTKGKCHHLSQDKMRTSYLLIKNYSFPDFFLSHKFSLTQSEISWLLPVYEKN